MLVVAKNVKITGAPEGTKIVVADGATGLTVNGKAVSDDQTYIVPKTEPAKPSGGSSGGYSHSHSYDATSHKCSCGEFAPDVVATIGDTNGYLTLEAAVAAATNGATVKLVKGALLDTDISISSKITLDLNGNTIETNGKKISVAGTGDLTVTGNGIVNNQVDADKAGGTTNRYTMLSVEEGGKLTIENGTFTTKAAQIVYTYGSTTIRGGTFKNTSTNTSEETDEALNTGALIVVCGTLASLTMTDGTVTTESQYLYGVFVRNGGNAIFGDEETENGPSIHTHRYAAIGENNTMATANITIYGGEYTVSTVPASDAWKPFCATIYASASGEINIHGGTFTGYYAISDRYEKVEQTVTITGGTFNGAEADLYVTSEGGKGTTANRIIAIAGGTFDHNPDVKYIATGYVATANTNSTWTVSEKTGVTLVAQVGVNKYESLADAISAVQGGNTIKMLKDVDNAAGISVNTGKTFTIDFDGHTYKVNKPGAGSTGTETAAFQLIKGQTITFKNGTICADADNLQEATAPAKNILRFFQSYANVNFVDMTIDGTNINGNNSVIEFANGNVSITGSTSITAKPGAKAINVDTWKIDSYSGGAHVTINTTGSIGDIYLYSEGNKTEDFTKSTLNISGGIFGSVTGDENKEYIASITGGTFSSDPTAYVAEGYIARENNGKYVVSMGGTAENPYTP